MKTYLIVISIFIAAITGGCAHNHSHASDDHHGHSHNETLQLFSYKADLELFAEASPFVAGDMGKIKAHFTSLKDFKPLPEGSITATLFVEEESVSQTLNEPTKAGVYLFEITPKKAGTGKIVFDIKTSSGSYQMVVPDITVYKTEHLAHEAAAKAAISVSNGIAFTKEQSWKVDFATHEVKKEPFGQVIRTTAQILPSQGDERTITAKTSGVVQFSNNNLVEGKTVGAGQSLFTIDGSGMAENNLAVRYAEAESEYNRAKAEYERKSELAKENIVSQSDFLKAKTEYAHAEANYNNLKSNFSSGIQAVVSPISGYVTRVLVQNGQYIEAGQPVLIVAQNRDLFIKAELQPKFFEALSGFKTANIHTLNNNRTYSLEELGGRLLSYGKSIDVNNPLIPVVFQVNNRAGLLAGSFVELFLKTETHAQALTVPNESLIEEMGVYFVFVQRTPELFEKVAVTKGASDGILTEIIDGVMVGDRVVSKGAILVKLSQSSGALDPHAGHAH